MKRVFLLPALFAVMFAQQPKELRGVWITNVDSDILTSDTKIAKGMDYLASIGINVIFPVVWNAGYTLYPSAVMKNLIGKEIFPGTAYQNRDPLRRLVIEAHRNGIEVIPWFEYGLAAKYATSASDIGEILTARPEWAAKNANGKFTTNVSGGGLPSFVWMNGINPDVQRFMLSLVTEVTDNYDVDGIQGDDRLPALPYEGGYDSVTVALYKAEHLGASPPAHTDANWIRWRADKLNALMKMIYDSVKVRGQHLIVSSGPSEYAWGFPSLLQDSKTWVEQGMIDNFIPQLYPDAGDRTTPQSATNAYIFRLDRALGYVPASKKSIFFGGVLSKVGGYVADYQTLIGNVNANRSRGINGETYFFYEGIANTNRKNGDSLRATVYRKDALLPYRNGKIWRPKGIVVNETDPAIQRSGTWISNVSPGFTGGILVHPDTGTATIDYSFSVPVNAWYDLYAYIGSSPTIYTTKAKYVVRTAVDTQTVLFDQSRAGSASTWQKISTVRLDSGVRSVVSLSNAGVEPNKVVMADGMMLLINRKLSPEADVTTPVKKNSGSEGPLTFALRQNFPNPFNPMTTIEFTIEKPGHAELTVFDVMGREIAVLYNAPAPAGTRSVRFDGSALASGVYYYRLRTEAGSAVQKMLLIK